MYSRLIRLKRLFSVRARGFVTVLLSLIAIVNLKWRFLIQSKTKKTEDELWSEHNYEVRYIYLANLPCDCTTILFASTSG